MKKVLIYKGFERFWHWMQATLIILLAITGFEIHGSYRFFGYQNAVKIHSAAAVSYLILVVFAVFWHFTTGEWRQYIPTRKYLKAQLEYYLIGIFRNAPHPVKKNVLSKLNPLQRLVYLGLKLLVIPVMVVSGLFYMNYRYPQSGGFHALGIHGLKTVALFHTAGAFLLVIFLVVHLYLITTGQTLTSNLKAMLTGFEDIEDEDDERSVENPTYLQE